MASPRSFFESPVTKMSPSKPQLGHKQSSSPNIQTITRTLQSNRRLNQLQKNYAQTLLKKSSRLGSRNAQSQNNSRTESKNKVNVQNFDATRPQILIGNINGNLNINFPQSVSIINTQNRDLNLETGASKDEEPHIVQNSM